MAAVLHNEDETTDVDEIFRRVGRFGRYQLIQSFQLYVSFVPVAWNVMGLIFLIANVTVQCQSMENTSLVNISLPSNSQIVYKKCDVEIHTNGSVTDHLPCDNGYFYPKGKHLSVKSEWDLVCNRESIAELIISSYNIGKLVSAYILPSFSDKYGRKWMLITTHVLLSLVNVIGTFSPTYLFYLAAKTVAGFFESQVDLTCAVYLVELFPTENRTRIMVLGGSTWAVSVMILALIAYLLEPFGWRSLNLFIGVMSIFSIMQIWTLDESFRWLVAQAKWGRADAILKKICRTNKVDYHEIAPLLKYRHMLKTSDNGKTELKANEEMKMIPANREFVNREPTEQQKEGKKEMIGVLYIYWHPVLRKILFVCMYLWFVSALVYYGLYITLSNFSENKFLSFFLNGVMELCAAVSTLKIMTRFGRKKATAGYQTLAGVSIIIAATLAYFKGDNYGMHIVSNIFSLAGLFSISAAFLCLWFYSSEMFPTKVRNVGLATSATASRIGNMLAPFSNTLANYALWIPGMIFGALCLLTNVLIVLLPETVHRQLPQTAEEVEAWQNEGREKKKRKKKIVKDKEEENNHEFL